MSLAMIRGFWAIGLALILSGVSGRTATHLVRMGNYLFNPTNLTINAGDSVLWTNVSFTAHDATGPTNLWTSPNVAFTGTYSFRFTNGGVYPYICALHIVSRPQQTGTVTVISIVTNPPTPVTLLNPRWVGGRFVFAFNSKAGTIYDVLRANSIPSQAWNVVATVTGNGAQISVTNQSPSAAAYYRVESK